MSRKRSRQEWEPIRAPGEWIRAPGGGFRQFSEDPQEWEPIRAPGEWIGAPGGGFSWRSEPLANGSEPLAGAFGCILSDGSRQEWEPIRAPGEWIGAPGGGFYPPLKVTFTPTQGDGLGTKTACHIY